MSKAKQEKDLKKVAKREKLFSTLAHEEGQGARKRAAQEGKAGLKASAKDSRWEAKVDEKFAKIRARKVGMTKGRLKKLQK